MNNINKDIYIEIGKHFENIKELEKMKDFYLKAVEVMNIFYIIINDKTNSIKEKVKLNKILENSKIKKSKEYFEQIENDIKINIKK